jgi:hypothetical protein
LPRARHPLHPEPRRTPPLPWRRSSDSSSGLRLKSVCRLRCQTAARRWLPRAVAGNSDGPCRNRPTTLRSARGASPGPSTSNGAPTPKAREYLSIRRPRRSSRGGCWRWWRWPATRTRPNSPRSGSPSSSPRSLTDRGFGPRRTALRPSVEFLAGRERWGICQPARSRATGGHSGSPRGRDAWQLAGPPAAHLDQTSGETYGFP